MHRTVRWFVSRMIFLLAVALAPAEVFAQGVTGAAVTGVVTDPSGAPVPDASVQLRNTSTGALFNATTVASGKYFLDNVAAGGPYSLTVQGGIFEPVTREGIQLSLGQRLTADVQLKTMMGEAIDIVLHLDSLDDKSRTGPATRVGTTAIAKLPLQGRNFTDLISTDPRVSGTSVAGTNNRYNNIQIDGGANNDLFGLANSGTPGGQANAKPLSVEAVKEFVVQIAPFDVRQGGFVGGLVNMITKSGTNEVHGSLYGYYQDRQLAGFREDASFLGYRTSQYGLTFSGPIVKDLAHLFVSTDIQERASSFGSSFQIGGVNSASDIARAGFDLATAQRVADILKNKYRMADPGTALAPELTNPDRNLFVKVSTSLIPKSQLELTFNYVKATQDQLARTPTGIQVPTSSTTAGRLRDGYQLSNAGYGQANNTYTGRVKLTTNWDGGRFSNEFLAGFSIIRDARKMPNELPLILVKVGKIGVNDSWIAAGGERFSQANILDQNVFQLQDNLTWSLDNHRITIGTGNEFFNFRNVFLQAAYGAWAFNSIAELDAGTPAAFQRRFLPAGSDPSLEAGTAGFSVAQLGLYVQDEWSPFRRLTVTPGVRVDVPLLSSAVTNQSLLTGTATTLNIDTGKMPSGNLLFSPRLGFNWDVDGTNDTVVRGGVGLFSGRPPYVWLSNAYSINGLTQVEVTCAGTSGVPAFSVDPNAQPYDCKGGTGRPTAPTNAGEIDYFDPNTKYPQNLRASLGVDRRLPWGMTITGDLLWGKDVNAWYYTDENLKVVGADAEGRTTYGTFNATTGAATPTRFDTTNLIQAVRVTNKDGGYTASATVQVEKRFLQNYSIAVGYTYSKSMDLMSLTSSQALSNFQFAPIDGSIADRNARPSAFDRPHKITVTATAELPYGFGLGVSYVGQSGLPYTWTTSNDVNGDGISGNDLVYVPATPDKITFQGGDADGSKWKALNAFIDGQKCLADARGGLVQRGACRNPWQDFLNMRLTWTSPKFFKDDHRIEVQWDLFNVLNFVNSYWGHALQAAGFENFSSAFLRATGYDVANNRPIYTFGGPNTIVSTIYSPTASRWRMQLGARYVF